MNAGYIGYIGHYLDKCISGLNLRCGGCSMCLMTFVFNADAAEDGYGGDLSCSVDVDAKFILLRVRGGKSPLRKG